MTTYQRNIHSASEDEFDDFLGHEVRQAEIGGANFEGAILQTTILRETNLDGVDLSGVDLTTTLLPPGYKRSTAAGG